MCLKKNWEGEKKKQNWEEYSKLFMNIHKQT